MTRGNNWHDISAFPLVSLPQAPRWRTATKQGRVQNPSTTLWSPSKMVAVPAWTWTDRPPGRPTRCSSRAATQSTSTGRTSPMPCPPKRKVRLPAQRDAKLPKNILLTTFCYSLSMVVAQYMGSKHPKRKTKH